MSKKDDTTEPTTEPAKIGQNSSVVWNDSKMNTTYANVVNVTSTREEVTLFLGTNQTWNVTDSKEIEVLLSNRIILNPHAGKRLWALLGGVLKQYETRFGQINLDLAKKPD